MRKLLIAFFLVVFSAPLFAKDTKIVIFGNGRTPSQIAEGLNDLLLSKMFISIKDVNPDAVFYTGNLLLQLEDPEKYSEAAFKRQLNVFSQIKDSYLGKSVPFYPTLGNHKPTTFEVIEVFREHFKIKNIAPRPPHHLSYTVDIDGDKFIVLVTGYRDPNDVTKHGVREDAHVIDWLEGFLKNSVENKKNRFVFGHFPGFSSTGPAGVYKGLDQDPIKRDLFWGILKQNRVNAYFCSHEPLYDRSNRNGVWQVVSGGVGGRRTVFTERPQFTHYVVLTIPDDDRSPFIEVFDLEGKMWDNFNVTPLDYPIHQLRITEN